MTAAYVTLDNRTANPCSFDAQRGAIPFVVFQPHSFRETPLRARGRRRDFPFNVMPSFFVEQVSGGQRATTSGDDFYEQLAARKLAQQKANQQEVSDSSAGCDWLLRYLFYSAGTPVLRRQETVMTRTTMIPPTCQSGTEPILRQTKNAWMRNSANARQTTESLFEWMPSSLHTSSCIQCPIASLLTQAADMVARVSQERTA